MPGLEQDTDEKLTRAKYTAEFKQEAVRQVRAGRSIAVVARVLGIPTASLSNWMRTDARGQVPRAAEGESTTVPPVTPEQAEIARLRAEVARLKMGRDIAKKAAAYFARDVLQGTPGSGQ